MLSEDAMLRWVRHMWRQRSDWLQDGHDGLSLLTRTWEETEMLSDQTGRRWKAINACLIEWIPRKAGRQVLQYFVSD
jgi:hypothetical protein